MNDDMDRLRNIFLRRLCLSFLLGLMACSSVLFWKIENGANIGEATYFCFIVAVPFLLLKPFVNLNSSSTREMVKGIDKSISINFSNQAACLAMNSKNRPRYSLFKFELLQYTWSAISAYLLFLGGALLLSALSIVNTVSH